MSNIKAYREFYCKECSYKTTKYVAIDTWNLPCDVCDGEMEQKYGINFQFGTENSDFGSKFCRSSSGYARNMDEMIEYQKQQGLIRRDRTRPLTEEDRKANRW